jgi:hypothetical protein
LPSRPRTLAFASRCNSSATNSVCPPLYKKKKLRKAYANAFRICSSATNSQNTFCLVPRTPCVPHYTHANAFRICSAEYVLSCVTNSVCPHLYKKGVMQGGPVVSLPSHANTQTHSPYRARARAHTHTHTHTLAITRTHTNTRSLSITHTHTHTHIHTHREALCRAVQ